MVTVLAVVTGALYAAGLYMMLRRSIVKSLIGLALLGHAANLLLFTAAGLTRGRPPLVPERASTVEPPVADPLPQALVLTAIVISFGMTALLLAIALRARAETGSDHVDGPEGESRENGV